MAPRSTRPRRRRELAGQQLEQRRLARAVDADERHAVAGAQAPRHVAQQRLVAEGQRDADGVEHLVAQARRREAQQLGAVAHLGLVGDQRVGGVDAELRLRGAGRRAAAQPGELLAQQLAAAVVARGGLAVALGAGQDVGRVAALVLVDGLVGDLPRRGADRVEKPAIVGDHEHRAAPRRRGGGPASRRPRRRGGSSARRAAAARGRRAAAGRSRCAAARRPDRAAIGVSIPSGKRVSPTPPSSPSSTSRKRASAAHSWSARRPTSSSRIVCASSSSSPWPSSASRSVRSRVIAPASGVLDAGDEAQQRRLAVAVSPDDPDPLAGVDPERDVVQDRAAAVALGDGLEVDEVAGRGGHVPLI